VSAGQHDLTGMERAAWRRYYRAWLNNDLRTSTLHAAWRRLQARRDKFLIARGRNHYAEGTWPAPKRPFIR
jgi:hypothetical protein